MTLDPFSHLEGARSPTGRSAPSPEGVRNLRRAILVLSVATLVLPACRGETTEGASVASTTMGASPSSSPGTATPSPTQAVQTEFPIPPWPELVAMYDYEAGAPLDYHVLGKQRESGATVSTIEYRSSGDAVPAYHVIPDGQGPFPAVLHAHGAGASPDWYLPDATLLARDGYASLLITSPENRAPFLPISLTYDLRADVKGMVRYVMDLRRGIDLLQTLPEIDAERIGFIGYGDGAWAGAILSGIDARPDAYVLVSPGGWPCTDAAGSGTRCGVPDPSWFGGSGVPTGAAFERYVGGIMVIDSVPYLEHNETAAFLFQGSKLSGGSTRSIPFQRVPFAAAPAPKTFRWYPGVQALTCYRATCDPGNDEAYVFHRAWLERNV